MLYYIEQDTEAPPVIQLGNRLVPLLDITSQITTVSVNLSGSLCTPTHSSERSAVRDRPGLQFLKVDDTTRSAEAS